MFMGPAFRLVRLVQIAMLMSIVLYVAVGEFIVRTPAAHMGAAKNGLFYAFSLASISTLGAALVVRRTLVLPAENLLREKPENPGIVSRWRTGYILLYVLCEALAVFGLVLRIAGFALGHVWGFYLGALLLLLLFSPRTRPAPLR